MSVQGTGIAAGVSQTTHAAQQVSRQRDKARTDEKSQLRQTIDRVESVPRTARTEDSDQELPDHQPPGYEPPHQDDAAADPPADPAANPEQPDPPPASGEPPYRHIDIRA